MNNVPSFWPYADELVVRRKQRKFTPFGSLITGTLLSLAGTAALFMPKASMAAEPAPAAIATHSAKAAPKHKQAGLIFNMDGHTYKLGEKSDDVYPFHVVNESSPSTSAPEIIRGKFKQTPEGVEGMAIVTIPNSTAPNSPLSIAEYEFSERTANKGTRDIRNLKTLAVTAVEKAAREYDLDKIGDNVITEVTDALGNQIHPHKPHKPKRIHKGLIAEIVMRAGRIVTAMAAMPYNLARISVDNLAYASGVKKRPSQLPVEIDKEATSEGFVFKLPQEVADYGIMLAMQDKPVARLQLLLRSSAQKSVSVESVPLTTAFEPISASATLGLLPVTEITQPPFTHHTARAHRDTLAKAKPVAAKNPILLAQASPAPAATPHAAARPHDTKLQSPAPHGSSLPLAATLAVAFGIGAAFAGRRDPFSPSCVPAFSAAGNPPLPPYLLPAPAKTGHESGADLATKRNANTVTHQVRRWVKEHAPEMAVGGITGAGVRMGLTVAAKFALAKLAFAAPAALVAASPLATTVITAVALGAAAGGASKIATTYIFHKEKMKEKNWAGKAFLQGAGYGAVSGFIGAGVVDLFRTDSILHGFFHGHHAPTGAVNTNAANIHQAPAAGAVHNNPAPVSSPHTPGGTPTLAIGAPQGFLTADQLKALSPDLRHLAQSGSAKDWVNFCQAMASKATENPHGSFGNPADWINRGLKIANDHHVHGKIVEQLHADKAFGEAWGKIGFDKDTADAIAEAKLSNHVMNNYGTRLLRCVLGTRTPAPA